MITRRGLALVSLPCEAKTRVDPPDRRAPWVSTSDQ